MIPEEKEFSASGGDAEDRSRFAQGCHSAAMLYIFGIMLLLIASFIPGILEIRIMICLGYFV